MYLSKIFLFFYNFNYFLNDVSAIYEIDSKEDHKDLNVKTENCKEVKIENFSVSVKNEQIFDDKLLVGKIGHFAENATDQKHEEFAIKKESDQQITYCTEEDNGDENRKISPEETDKLELETVKQFDAMKNDLQLNKNYKQLSRNKFEAIVAQKLGKSRAQIYALKRKLKKKYGKIINTKIEENAETKLVIINQFNEMKAEEKRNENHKTKDLTNIEEQIAKKLGISRKKIYKWKKELANHRKLKENDETKIKKIKEFDQMRKECIRKNRNKSVTTIESEVANKLGTSRRGIYKMKRETESTSNPGKISIYMEIAPILVKENWIEIANQQKFEKIMQFEKCKKEFTRKFNLNTTEKIKGKIAAKIGVGLNTIYKWKKKFGLCKKAYQKFNDAEKIEMVRKFEKYKAENPNVSDRKIGEKLNICRKNVQYWKDKT